MSNPSPLDRFRALLQEFLHHNGYKHAQWNNTEPKYLTISGEVELESFLTTALAEEYARGEEYGRSQVMERICQECLLPIPERKVHEMWKFPHSIAVFLDLESAQTPEDITAALDKADEQIGGAARALGGDFGYVKYCYQGRLGCEIKGTHQHS